MSAGWGCLEEITGGCSSPNRDGRKETYINNGSEIDQEILDHNSEIFELVIPSVYKFSDSCVVVPGKLVQCWFVIVVHDTAADVTATTKTLLTNDHASCMQLIHEKLVVAQMHFAHIPVKEVANFSSGNVLHWRYAEHWNDVDVHSWHVVFEQVECSFQVGLVVCCTVSVLFRTRTSALSQHDSPDPSHHHQAHFGWERECSTGGVPLVGSVVVWARQNLCMTVHQTFL